MSRTDHHRPYWVRVSDSSEQQVEHHDHRPVYRFCQTGVTETEHHYYSWSTEQRVAYTTRIRHGYRVGSDVACDIDDPFIGPTHRWWTGRGRCYRSLLTERPVGHVPKDVRHLYYYAGDRRRARDACRDLARDYNTSGEVDDADPPVWQHRHATSWWYY